ncbi:MAG: hemolysin secretion protein D [Candidatus Sedimenticola endophacoides]|uniref:Membrane fusion protein (MFP) family protein n=2 Tax=Candidatus Sedimenticola endophacoides TaxID=2548426 RepID=A0A657PTW1_9GAMM|nr:MAG: hemolysin secretion protein D [Candidatus Sedimenticola endophacoides]OQX37876.1 MAG: hemolysin secretion protein D [Candidatus Sedimenticola endophacoides]OQX42025.1 MAG: hemolysin secretion protein D [Candidatus Sedimenticola endophacoides]OQX44940.1 MAG: hemolysin secretion protein D [Candidatus Sedimenticola endophacoides]OQX46513.1 MAG: hemolysin secretion protein D [Candidatus Sedimenticola endophacoides]
MSKRGNWSDADYAPDVEAAIVQSVSPKSRLLLFAILLFFVIAVTWARYAVIDEVTHADGKVVPSSRVQVIQNLEGGILKQIPVTEGTIVEVGQVVLRIENTGVSASFGELQAKRFNLLGIVQRLSAEAEDKALKFSRELEQEHGDIVAAQRSMYNARKEELNTQLNILRQQADQRRQEKVELHNKLQRLRSSRTILNEEMAITEPLVEKSIVPKVELLKLKRSYNDLVGEIEATRLALPRADAAIVEADQRVEAKARSFRSETLRELARHKAELSSVEEMITAAEDKVVRTEVRSPVKGVVKEIKIRTVGGVIQPGEDLMEIVPIEDNLSIEARIRPADVAFLHPGQDAMVKFTAYDFSIYGGIPGKVEQISADTMLDERGDAFYRVIVKTETNNLKKGDEVLPIIPGMVAAVDVITGNKSILTYLLKPILKAKEQALTER